jgi:acyl-CoA reductase-like NAD-dependent aldehyde dehydrogenase
MSISFTERIERLEKRAEEIKEQAKDLKKLAAKQNRKLIDKRKIVIGSLLISQSKNEVYARKALIKLVECADEKDKELLKVLLNFETEAPKEPEAL